MPVPTDALALFDTAAAIDRLRFQLRALPAAPVTPSLSDISDQVRTLADITTEVADQVSRRLCDGLHTAPAQRAVDAFTTALAPVGEALTELGQLQRDAVFVRTNEAGTHAAQSPDTVELAIEVITESRDSAADILRAAADELRAAAARLTPAASRLQAAARARSSQIPVPQQTAVVPADTPPAAPAVRPTATKGR